MLQTGGDRPTGVTQGDGAGRGVNAEETLGNRDTITVFDIAIFFFTFVFGNIHTNLQLKPAVMKVVREYLSGVVFSHSK